MLFARYKALPVSALKEQIKSVASSGGVQQSVDAISAQVRSMVEKSDVIDLLIQLQMQSGRHTQQHDSKQHAAEERGREAEVAAAAATSAGAGSGSGGGQSKLFTFAHHHAAPAVNTADDVTSPATQLAFTSQTSPSPGSDYIDSPPVALEPRPLTAIDRFTVTSASSSQLAMLVTTLNSHAC